MLPEAVRRTRAYSRLAAWRGRRDLQRTLKRLGLQKAFDPDFKRRYMSGERFAPTEVEEHYGRIWEAFSDGCVLAHARARPGSAACGRRAAPRSGRAPSQPTRPPRSRPPRRASAPPRPRSRRRPQHRVERAVGQRQRLHALNELSTDYLFQTFPGPETLAAAIGLPDYECYLARTENDQWQGEYVFFSAALG